MWDIRQDAAASAVAGDDDDDDDNDTEPDNDADDAPSAPVMVPVLVRPAFGPTASPPKHKKKKHKQYPAGPVAYTLPATVAW